MKIMKKVFLLIAAIAVVSSASSQEKAFKPAGIWDNWFLQGQVGASYTFSEDNRKAGVGDLITPYVALSTGKYFSPALGARLQVGGWDAKTYLIDKDDTYSVKYLQAGVDGLLNFTNLFLPYNPDRVFNLIGFAGLSYVHGFKNSDQAVKVTNSVVPRGGFQFDFRVNPNINLNLEVAANLMNDDFNGIVGGKKYDGTLNALAGVTYRFGSGSFDRVDIIDPSTITSLNEQINAQRSQLEDKDKVLADKDNQLDALKAELSKKPSVIEKSVKKEEVLMNAVVVFRLGSAKLEQNQDINIFNVSKFMTENPDAQLVITGYADKHTGTPAVNQRLSERRAKVVFDILTEKYHVEPSRLTVKASGDKEQLFPTDQWNRVVVFTAIFK